MYLAKCGKSRSVLDAYMENDRGLVRQEGLALAVLWELWVIKGLTISWMLYFQQYLADWIFKHTSVLHANMSGSFFSKTFAPIHCVYKVK